MLVFKAVTLPKHNFDSYERSKTVIEANVDILLLFVCRTTALSEDAHLISDDEGQRSILLYLHVITPEPATEFSTPYRLLKIDKKVFLHDVLENGCVLPKAFFSSMCVKDFVPTKLMFKSKKQFRFKTSFLRLYTDFNSFFQNLYKNTNFQPLKMFVIAYYFFVQDYATDAYLVSIVFDKYCGVTEASNPKESYHLLNYMIQRYSNFSFQDMQSMIDEFIDLVNRFHNRSIETFRELSDKSKLYSHEEDGGLVCSFALTKCFAELEPADFISSLRQEKYDTMIRTFEQLIQYYDSSKFKEIDSGVLKNVKCLLVSTNDLTRYILSKSTDVLFGLNVKKGELKHVLSKSLLKYYGNFPPPDIEMHGMSILCEMMSGAFNNSNQFASCEIMKLRPFKPVLTKWKGNEYRVLTLNGLNIDLPLPSRVVVSIKRHLKNPSLSSYMNYCLELISHVESNEYFYHETVNPFLPIYTLVLDIDIYDKQYIRLYYAGEDQWKVKENLFESLTRLIISTCHDVMKLDVNSKNITCFMYESIRNDLDQIDKPGFKLGIRFTINFTTIVFKNSSVVHAFQNILNIYRHRFDHLREIQDENIFDAAIYGQPNHEIRLPMNLKPDGSKPLLPVFFKCHSENFANALFMTNALVHARNNFDKNAFVHLVSQVSQPTDDLVEKLGTSNILKLMFQAKSGKKGSDDNSFTDSLKSFEISNEHKKAFIEVIDRFSQGRLNRESNKLIRKILENKSLVFRGRNMFDWCSGLKFCAFTAHEKAMGNPCDYYVRLNRLSSGQLECYIYCHCFSTRCQEQTRKNCIGKCLI